MKLRNKLIGAATVASLIAGCGGSSDLTTREAIRTCHQRGAAVASCECAVRRAVSAGDTATALIREMRAGTASDDKPAVVAALECVKR